MTWFRRGQGPPVPPQPVERDDSPAALSARLRDLVTFVNHNAGRLPVEAVVSARRVADTVRETLADATRDADRGTEPDINVILSVRGIVDDYLPTTLERYLALDPSGTDVARPAGGTARQSLIEQIDALWIAAADVLAAAQARDVDDLVSQGNFLRTKFAGSDLDL
ncbi:MAG: hypothetical protein QOG80_2135 [Pseudonocardiales bacterium]|jgi:hypothetical protein|nr:hypothetical protein [Pseudonocardiales bacterium]